MMTDSLRQLFEKDFAFDFVISRSFPVIPVLSDTYPIAPFLSGHWRVGLSWHWHLYQSFGVSLQGGFAWYKHVLRATSASTAPYADDLPEGYRWLKYRLGTFFLQGGPHWRRKREEDIFPRYWIEVGGWLQRRIGNSLKYIVMREGQTKRVRWEGIPLFTPWQGGMYLTIGRQWLGLSAYYHLLPLFPKGPISSEPTLRFFPSFSRWEVGFLISI